MDLSQPVEHGETDVKRLIVFRFHKAPLVCRSRVALLRELNPDVLICGLFGGPRGVKGAAFRAGGKHLLGLDALYSSRESELWNWRNSDLVLAAWYRDFGCEIPFDIVHLVEWDLLLLEPLESLYSSVPKGAVGLTALTPITEVEGEWTWLRREESRREWEELLAAAHAEWGYEGIPHACLGPGSCFPRSFLEAYAAMDPPPLCNDELRLPLFAQILGFTIVDTGLRGRWRGEREDPFFHFRDREIELRAMQAELAKPDGWRAFHPVQVKLDPQQLLNGSDPRHER
jgi:hypothetical protein